MRVAALLFAFAASSAGAVSTVYPNQAGSWEYGSGYVKLKPGTGTGWMYGRQFFQPAGPTSPVGVSDLMRPTIGGRAIEVVGARAVGAGALGIAVANLGAAAWLGWTVGSAIAEFLNLGDAAGPRIYPGPDSWLHDQGVEPQGGVPTTGKNVCSGSGISINIPPCTGSPNGITGGAFGAPVAAGDACGAFLAWIANANPGTTEETVTSCTSSQVTVSAKYNGGGPYTATGNIQSVTYTPPASCPPYVDPFNPAYSNPSPAVGPDGKCQGGTLAPVSPEFVAGKIGNGDAWGQGIDYTKADEVASEVLNKGGTIPGASDSTLSGPASATGSPTTSTTTGPSGTTTTTTTQSTSYTYNGDTITYNITTTTSTTTGGQTTTTTTNEAGQEVEQKDECAKNPDKVGCMKPGELPTDKPVWSTVTVPWAAEDLGLGAACPPPVTWAVFGMSLAWNYQPVCDVAPLIRLALLAFAGLGAIGIIIKETSS